MGELQLKKDETIIKQDYEDNNEFKYDKKTMLVPKKKNRLICVFFSENKGCYFIFRKFNNKDNCFRFRKGLYIIDNESIHITKNGSRVSFYMEGISTPIKMTNIERYTDYVEYKDLYGNKQSSLVQKIRGLKFDSKILDTFCDERFAQNFTKTSIDKFQIFVLIFGIVTMIVSIINSVLIWYFTQKGGTP
jgi:hypothetical protein